MDTYKYIYIYIFTYVCTYVYMYLYIYVYICINMCVYIYIINSFIYIYVQTAHQDQPKGRILALILILWGTGHAGRKQSVTPWGWVKSCAPVVSGDSKKKKHMGHLEPLTQSFRSIGFWGLEDVGMDQKLLDFRWNLMNFGDAEHRYIPATTSPMVERMIPFWKIFRRWIWSVLPTSEKSWAPTYMGVSVNGDTPKKWFIRKNPIKMDDRGVPLF